MMPLSRRLLVTSALFMFLTALTGAVFRWIGAARDLRAKKLDVAPPFERVGEGPPTRAPLATGAWWTNLVVGGPSSSGDGLGTAFATPYTVSVLPDKGVVLGYGEVLATNDSLTLATSQDLIVSLKGGLEKREVVAYDDLSLIHI